MKALILWLVILAASIGTYFLSHRIESRANLAAIFSAGGARHEFSLYVDRVEPVEIDARVGDEVVFSVKDKKPHQISEERSERRGPRLDSGEIDRGESYSLVFSAPGEFSFYDRMNQDIRATVRVR